MNNIELKKLFKPYAEYKNTNIDWVGNIPTAWSVKKIKEHFYFEKGKHSAIFTQEYINSPENIGDYPVYSGQTGDQGVMGMIKSFVYNFSTPVVFTTTVGAKVMTPMLLKDKFSLSQNCLLMVPKDKSVDANYYYYQLFSLFKRVRDDIPDHMQPSLRISDLNKFVVVTPPYESQQKIAGYLDTKTAIIDKIIEQKQKLIELLKEKRTAVINKAVTRGLDVNVELVDSGVEWIGKIPREWSALRLKFICNFQSGDGFPDNLQGNDFGDIPFLKVSDINGEEKNVDSASNYVSQTTGQTMHWHLVKQNSILMAKIGAALAKNHRKVNQVDVYIDNNMLAVSGKPNMNDEYLYWLWKLIDVADFQNISSVPSVNMGWLKNYFYVVPSYSDQQKIADYLDKEINRIDHLTKKIQKSVELLQEFKSSLIYNVVTGKVKV